MYKRQPVAGPTVHARVPGEEFRHTGRGIGVGLGGGGLVELDGGSVDAVDTGHQLAGADETGQGVLRVSGALRTCVGAGFHAVNPTGRRSGAGTLPSMETDQAPLEAPPQPADQTGGSSPPGPDGFHPPEASIDTSEASIDGVDGLLDEVEAALTRLDDGTYGMCESCGAPIEDAQLADSPTARSCSACLPS